MSCPVGSIVDVLEDIALARERPPTRPGLEYACPSAVALDSDVRAFLPRFPLSVAPRNAEGGDVTARGGEFRERRFR